MIDPSSARRALMFELAEKEWGALDTRLLVDGAEDGLTELWELYAWSFGAETVCLVPCGSCCALVQRLGRAHYRVLALCPVREAWREVSYRSLCNAGTNKLPDTFITQWTMRQKLGLSVTPISVGDRIAGVQKGTGFAYLALCVSLDDTGRVTEIMRKPDGEIEPASNIAPRWFPVINRDDAFDERFARTSEPYAHYRAMQGALFQKQASICRKRGEKIELYKGGGKLPAWANAPRLGVMAKRELAGEASGLKAPPAHRPVSIDAIKAGVPLQGEHDAIRAQMQAEYEADMAKVHGLDFKRRPITGRMKPIYDLLSWRWDQGYSLEQTEAWVERARAYLEADPEHDIENFPHE